MALANKSPLEIAKEVFLDARRQAMVAAMELADELKRLKELNEVWKHQQRMSMNALDGSIEEIRNATTIIRYLSKNAKDIDEKMKNAKKKSNNAEEKLKDALKKLQVLQSIPSFARAA
mmetsp:Transcript_22910/g.32846  ORF Transcript_22910/g.32846 Transcript_22910/m.32846 type:complete len:118 (+) Transcript_22910:37-390(+)|eukprot:CAMPEP_0172434300 /NCGR_PEP_ID=MMETSP1064-20121228/70560_1 /TAXON_ID=202472 /ORGANISM="Aulacoseira subarctica , Strain CCAP 1002/5" /LENGTH=117 /DNA_ID=CAMNT_0013182511 /DNA_START=759 /DNA_END=1112 /DNA_ORIENTATION=-